MKDKILEVLKLTRNNALNMEEIYNKIYHNEIDMNILNSLKEEINKLQEEHLVYCVNSKKGLYTLNPFREGIFHIRRNKDVIVTCDLGDIKIEKSKTYGALEGDKVLIRITDFNYSLGSIKEIIERKGLIGEVKTIKGKRFVMANDTLYMIKLPNSIVDGMLVGIKVDKKKIGRYYNATLDRVICHKNAPRVDEFKILYDHGFNNNYEEEIKEELKSIPSEVRKIDFINRKDLTDKTIFTIDGDDTKDIDDAISIEKKGNNYLLGVHIADVSYYVKENSYIDKSAREKGTSVYMPGVVFPMYPVFLSNGICSLNPDVDRCSISCVMEIDKNGKLVDFDIFKSIIHSRIQMTYKKVNKILDENIVDEKYKLYVDDLKLMKELADILHNMRIKRGSLDFDREEIKIETDINGKVTSISKRTSGTGENLIEDFMLMANECVATYIYNMGLNSIYRVHDLPSEERLIKTINVIKNYGEKLDIKLNVKDPKIIQKLLNELKNSPKFNIYSYMLLRCMAKAEYSNINDGHFGIGIDAYKNEAYTHFTSPIRRYPDTTIHRILTNILEGNIEKIESNLYKDNVIDIAVHSSIMEQEATACEKEADKMKMAEYMEQFVGKTFEGFISGFTMHGMFVCLDNLIEGRVGFNTMDDYYNYNEDLEIIVGEKNKKVYKLGDKVKVKLVKSCKETREIDFEIVTNNNKSNNKPNINTKNVDKHTKNRTNNKKNTNKKVKKHGNIK